MQRYWHRMLIDCFRLPAFPPDDLDAVRTAFSAATPIHLGQPWLQAPETHFAPAVVRTGWRADSLLVLAELTDASPTTGAQDHNQRFWEMGDTFEMFLQPEPGLPYVELHVAPNNFRLQLRFNSPPSQRPSTTDPFTNALIRADSFESRTWTHADGSGWSVFAEIRAALVRPQSLVPLAGSTWRASFCRYDYTPGREAPVISSSSPHTEPAFHRPEEWNSLRFA
jgi:hypothetical protein